MKILIDNGHGVETPGKCSPDHSYREYAWAREIAWLTLTGLKELGYDAELLVPGVHDVPLAERVRRVNEFCDKLGEGNVLLVSIHSNAKGKGEWMDGRGWSAFTTKGETKADKLATCLYDMADQYLKGRTVRKDMSDGDPDWEENFYILRKTKCPAVLTENFFHDNKEDLAYMVSKEGKHAIAQTHIHGIIKYVNKTK